MPSLDCEFPPFLRCWAAEHLATLFHNFGDLRMGTPNPRSHIAGIKDLSRGICNNRHPDDRDSQYFMLYRFEDPGNRRHASHPSRIEHFLKNGNYLQTCEFLGDEGQLGMKASCQTVHRSLISQRLSVREVADVTSPSRAGKFLICWSDRRYNLPYRRTHGRAMDRSIES